jgi:hypothetical protein
MTLHVLYCDRFTVCTSPETFYTENFLTTLASRRIASGTAVQLSLLAIAGESLDYSVAYHYRSNSGSTVHTDSFVVGSGDTAATTSIVTLNISEADILAHAASANIELVSYTITCGQRYGWYPYYDTSDDCYSVPVNGQDANPEGQKLTDILFAEADASFDHPNLYLIFHHKMARLIFNVKTSEDDGFYAEDIFGTAEESEIHSSYGVLYNTPLMATVWPKTGVVEGSETKGNLMLLNGTDDTEKCVRQYVLLVPEQKATSYYHCFNDGDSSKITFKTKLGNKTWKAGYSYTYNITIRNTGMTVTSETVEEWIDGGVEDLDAY